MQSLNNFKNTLFVASFALGIASTVSVVYSPNQTIKDVSRWLLGFSVGSLVVGELATSRGLKDIDQLENDLRVQGRNKDSEIERLETDKRFKDSEIDYLKNLKSQTERQLEGLHSSVVEKDLALVAAKKQIEELREKIKAVAQFSCKDIYQVVKECYEVQVRKLEGLISGLSRNYPELREQLQDVLIEVDSFRTRFTGLLTDYEKLTTFDELLDTGLELQQKIIDRCNELKIKAQTIVIRHLGSIAQDSIPLDFYEQTLLNLAEKAKSQIEDNQKAIASEWVAANNDTVSRYETEFNEVLETAKYSVARMEQLNNRIAELESELADLKKPLMMFGESIYANAANAIANYYYSRYQYLLDCINWEETDTGYKILFAIRRNPGLTEKELYADNSREQLAAFTNALHGTLPSFDFNRQNSTITIDVALRRATKKNELPRGVKTADKFPQIVNKWKRVRITGGSESGKSPTAENMIVCILLSQGGTVDFYDPMHDSVKNYRTIPAIGKSHEDSIRGLKEYEAKMASSPSDKLYLAWFDEIDTTLDKNPKSASDLKAVLKQSSHKNSGLVITGQNANVRNLKGNFDRSDMNNFVCVHIGDNYKDAVRNSNLSESEQDELMKKGDTIKDWCLSQNELNGLTLEDADAYSFALVLEPNKKGYYILLPDFGTYTYDMIKINGVETNSEAHNTALELIRCPHCESNSFRKHSPVADKSKYRYQCKNLECKKTFIADKN